MREQFHDIFRNYFRSQLLQSRGGAFTQERAAAVLHMSVRAYAALEDEGYLVTRPGVGAFAAAGTGEHPRQEALLKQFDATARELLFLGLTPEELAGRVTRAVRREEDAL